jgi:methionyl-tRNA formyltransferase
MPQSLDIIFAGSGAFGVPTLRALLAAGHRVVRVFTQPDRPAGRGKKLTLTPVAELATSLSLDLMRTDDINAQPLPPADVMVVIAFGQKIGEPAVHHPRLGSVNLHASILPKYRGAAPINWAIIDGNPTTGNSIIRLASKMDAGAVLAQSQLNIGETETAGELHDRLSIDGAPLMLKVIEDLASGTAVETEQDHKQASIAPKLSREIATIDWSQPASRIARRMNGLSPWPGCRVRLMDGSTEIARLMLVRARALPLLSHGIAGTIGVRGEVIAGDSQCVELLEVQPEGKRPMPLADFRNGRPWKAGMRLENIPQ